MWFSSRQRKPTGHADPLISITTIKGTICALVQGVPLSSHPQVYGPTPIINGRVSYVPQAAFIIGATVRENILFGASYDETRYRAAVEAACLNSDLLTLPAGDATELGVWHQQLDALHERRISEGCDRSIMRCVLVCLSSCMSVHRGSELRALFRFMTSSVCLAHAVEKSTARWAYCCQHMHMSLMQTVHRLKSKLWYLPNFLIVRDGSAANLHLSIRWSIRPFVHINHSNITPYFPLPSTHSAIQVDTN